jgi:uncharacterized Zn-binding protein involved in type VI secretion
MKTGPMYARLLAALLVSSVMFASCAKQESIREIDWAKAALARNPNYEIVATDETAGVFTVRDTVTGDVTTLKLNELIAAPKPPREAVTPAALPDPGPVESPESAEGEDASALADNQTTETVEVPPSAGGPALAQGPGYSITRATGARPDASAATLEGPGYKIERQATALAGNTPAQAADPQAANGEPRTDPIICQGNRLMRIDGETLSFSGDAVIAERGCDLYISNARIRAGGVGIIARQQARVHIVNSTIGGVRGSYEASDGAEIYVARSTFTGVGRRFDGASMTDLGGNSYETD